MATRPSRTDLAAVLRRAAHPPLRAWQFWVIQAMVVIIAVVHLIVDHDISVGNRAFPVDFPVALFIIPVGYAALQYGLTGSAATGLWATLLWLPDLLLPSHEGHTGTDIVALCLVDAVAVFVGHRIEAERLTHANAARASAERLAAEARYRQLFDANKAPILVLDGQGLVANVNPAARSLFGTEAIGLPLGRVLDTSLDPIQLRDQVFRLADGRDYRFSLVELPADVGRGEFQVILEDVTEERREGRRAAHYAQLVVQAEEDQRRRLSRELHDEPLQLFLHLARRLETLGGSPKVPANVREALEEARGQALDAAARLRNLARDLRPPALDQFGLVAALSSLVVDAEDEGGLVAELEVTGEEARLPVEVELGAFRIVQEAVRNTLKHAEASRLEVSVGFGPGAVTLRIVDDGKGFVPGAFDELNSSHLGLVGMRERAHLLGGSHEVRAAPGNGTVVTASVPLPERAGEDGGARSIGAAGRPDGPLRAAGAPGDST